METSASEVRPGHLIGGARVLWARPIPDYTWVCMAVVAAHGGDDAGLHWYRPDDLVDVGGAGVDEAGSPAPGVWSR
jgi:hypothetical protein